MHSVHSYLALLIFYHSSLASSNYPAVTPSASTGTLFGDRTICDESGLFACSSGTCVSGSDGYLGCCTAQSCAPRTTCLDYHDALILPRPCSPETGGCVACTDPLLPYCVRVTNTVEKNYGFLCGTKRNSIIYTSLSKRFTSSQFSSPSVFFISQSVNYAPESATSVLHPPAKTIHALVPSSTQTSLPVSEEVSYHVVNSDRSDNGSPLNDQNNGEEGEWTISTLDHGRRRVIGVIVGSVAVAILFFTLLFVLIIPRWGKFSTKKTSNCEGVFSRGNFQFPQVGSSLSRKFAQSISSDSGTDSTGLSFIGPSPMVSIRKCRTSTFIDQAVLSGVDECSDGEFTGSVSVADSNELPYLVQMNRSASQYTVIPGRLGTNRIVSYSSTAYDAPLLSPSGTLNSSNTVPDSVLHGQRGRNVIPPSPSAFLPQSCPQSVVRNPVSPLLLARDRRVSHADSMRASGIRMVPSVSCFNRMSFTRSNSVQSTPCVIPCSSPYALSSAQVPVCSKQHNTENVDDMA